MDMLEAARLARSHVGGKSWEQFDADVACQDAVIRRLEIIGEASRRVSQQTQTLLATVPWRLMVGLRNMVIHQYDDVDLLVVWDTVQDDLPALILTLEAALGAEDTT